MEETARLATLDDLEVLTEIASTAIAELTPNRGGEVWRRQQSRPIPPTASLRDAIGDDGQLVLVGCIDDVPVAYAVVRDDVLDDDGHLGVIEDLYTLPGARAVGVGEVLMDAIVAWCRDRGCFGVDALALPGDRHTKNFFESFGLVARAIIVHRRLDS